MNMCMYIHAPEESTYFTYIKTCIESTRIVIYEVKKMEIRDKVGNKVKQETHLA